MTQLKLSEDSGKVRLTVQDNGKGIANLDQTGSGIGMIGMRARARSLGGEVATRSTPGQGVTIEVWVPATAAPVEENDPHPVG